jgi:hypothetical protein
LEENMRFWREIIVVRVSGLGVVVSIHIFIVVTPVIRKIIATIRWSIIWWTSFRKSGSPRCSSGIESRMSRSLWVVMVLECGDR